MLVSALIRYKDYSYQYRSHCGDKTVIRSSYLNNDICYTCKTDNYIEMGPWVIRTSFILLWCHWLMNLIASHGGHLRTHSSQLYKHRVITPKWYRPTENAMQGWVSSGRNLFLPGHPEKSGRNLFLPLLSGQNWKKLDKTGKTMKEVRNAGKK